MHVEMDFNAWCDHRYLKLGPGRMLIQGLKEAFVMIAKCSAS